MVSSYNEFIGQPEPASEKTSYSAYADKIWNVKAGEGTQAAGGQIADAPGAPHSFQEAMAQLGELRETMSQARRGDKAALKKITKAEEFQVENKVQRVRVPEELMRRFNPDGDPGKLKFGVQTIESPEQLKLLHDKVALVREYMPRAELHLVEDDKGNKTALVMGVDANEFNSVVAAERKKAALTLTVDKALKSEPVREKTPEISMAALNDRMRELGDKYALSPRSPSQEQAEPRALATPGMPQAGRGRELA